MHSRHFFHISGWNEDNERYDIWRLWEPGLVSGDPHLHEGGQVWVVVVQRGDDVELDLNEDAFAQVILVSDAGQSVQELDLRRSEQTQQKCVYVCSYKRYKSYLTYNLIRNKLQKTLFSVASTTFVMLLKIIDKLTY